MTPTLAGRLRGRTAIVTGAPTERSSLRSDGVSGRLSATRYLNEMRALWIYDGPNEAHKWRSRDARR